MIQKYIVLSIFAVLFVYLAYRSYRKVRSYKDFNLAGRNIGFFPLVGSLGAAEFNTATLIGGASVAYSYGTVGIWYTSLIFIVVFAVYAFTVAQPYRRLGVTTIAGFFEQRFTGQYGEATRGLVSVITLTLTWALPATYLAGLSVVTSVLLGIEPRTAVLVITIFCLLLAMTGGLVTAISFDVVAYAMILLFIPVLFVISGVQAGGFSELGSVFESRFISLEPVWDLETYGFAAVVTWGFQVTMSYIAAPWYAQRVFSARNGSVAYRAMLTNTLLITTLYGLVAVTTMFSRVLMPNLAKPEEALPELILNYMPPVVQGLMLVTLLLVGISTMIAIWNSAISILVNDVVKRYIAPNKPDPFYVVVSRIGLLVLGLTTLVFGLSFVGSVLLALTYVSVFATLLAFPILAGLYWPQFSTLAALGSLAAGVIYVAAALVAGLPYYMISPIGFAASVIVGTTITLTGGRNPTQPQVERFLTAAHGKDKQEELPETRL